jgi:hypothetical protein
MGLTVDKVLSQTDILTALREVDALGLRKSTTAVTGLELTRQDLEDDLKLAGNIRTPLRNKMNRRTGNGKAHAYYKLLSNTGITQTNAKFFGTDPAAGFFAKGGLPNSVDPIYEYISRPYANVGDVMIVAWQDEAQDASYIDIKAQQKRVKMLNVGLMEEWATINGDSAASGGLVYDGFLTQIRNDGFNIVDVSASGGSALSYVTIQKLLFAIEKAGGHVTDLAMSYNMGQKITEMLQLYYAVRQMNNSSDGKWRGGFQVEGWNFGTGDVSFTIDQYMLPDPVTGLDNLLFLDMESTDDKNSGNVIEMVDVDKLHYVDLNPIATAHRGIVYETTMLQIGITQYQGLIQGINLNLDPLVPHL